ATSVLELSGTNSYVELPADAFTNLDEVTVEGWVKWESFERMSRFFDFAFKGFSLSAMNRFTNSTLRIESFRGDSVTLIELPEMLPLNQWTHIAVAAGTNGLQLFVNGASVGTNARNQFIATGREKRNYLGR